MYRSQSADTPEEIERFQLALRRAQSPSETFRQVAALREMALTLARHGLRERYPDASDDEIRWRLSATWIPREQLARILPTHLHYILADTR